MTADCSSRQGIQTLVVIHRPQGQAITDLFWDLYAYIEVILQPKLFLMNGEFAKVLLLQGLTDLSVNYVVRKSVTPRVKPLAMAYSLTDNWPELRTWKAITLLDKKKRTTITIHVTFQAVNGGMKALAIPPNSELSPMEVEQFCQTRFPIATGYRDKHAFQPRTCSNRLSIRLFLFLIACLLWNVWRMFLYLLKSTPRLRHKYIHT